MILRKATLEDLEIISEIELACFPFAEAAKKEAFEERLKVYGDYFLLAEEDGVVAGFINGPVINEKTLTDEMYEDTECHHEDGMWQTVFGINTLPAYRGKGVGKQMIDGIIDLAKQQGRKGCVLTCKDQLIHYYESFGFKSYGVSGSTHGGAVWYDMLLEF